MKGLGILIVFQALLSTIAAVLISQMSWVGKLGIRFLYRDYTILSVWWQTAILAFSVQLVVVLVLWINRRLLPYWISFFVTLFVLLTGILGCYWTYLDLTTTSHKYLRGNFPAGVYLFWASWFVSCFFFIFAKRRKTPVQLSES